MGSNVLVDIGAGALGIILGCLLVTSRWWVSLWYDEHGHPRSPWKR